MKHILIPTDFSIQSLQLAEQAVSSLPATKLNITLFHAFQLPYSEFELLLRDRKKPYTDLLTDNFRQACKQLKDKHSKKIQKISFNFLEGSTAALFRHFADANEIDLIFLPQHYHFKPVHKLSVDPVPLFKKSGVKIINELVRLQPEEVLVQKELPADFAIAG